MENCLRERLFHLLANSFIYSNPSIKDIQTSNDQPTHRTNR